MKDIILVVDSSGTRQTLTNILLSAGFEVRYVTDNRATKTLIGCAIPNTIVLGLDRGDVPTLSILSVVRRVAPNSAIIILSSNSDVRMKTRLIEQGADDYIEEPIDPLEVLARVRSIVRRQKLRL